MPVVFSNPALVPAILVESVTMADVVGLSDALAAKAAASHQHVAADVTDLPDVIGDIEPVDLTEVNNSIAALEVAVAALPTTEDLEVIEDAVAGKAPLSHTHAQSHVDGLVTALDGKAPTVHTHTQAQVDGLAASLAGMMLAPIYRTYAEGRPLDGDTTLNIQISGVLLPDITPYVLELVGVGTYSSNGTMTPSPSGVYVLLNALDLFAGTYRILVYQDGVYTGQSFLSYSGPNPVDATWGESTTGGATGVPILSWAETGGTPAGVLGRICIVQTLSVPEIWQCVRLAPVLWKKLAQAEGVMGI